MYVPKFFKEERTEVLHRLIQSNPLGLLISNGREEPLATSIPFQLIDDGSIFGLLRAHLARANPHWQTINGQNVLVVFQGSDAYISPNWYRSKNDTDMVVPTWNYAMVQARGIAKVIDDPLWLKQQITALTNQQEAHQTNPWKVSDAPESYVDDQIKAIVGLEIKLTRLQGKWKVSQNRPTADRASVAENLKADGKSEMSELVREYGGLDDNG